MENVLKGIDKLISEPMSRHTTFRVGGPARCFFMPSNVDEIISIIKYSLLNNQKYMILGNGSNVLFSDEGYDGNIIQIYSNMSRIKVEDEILYAEAGALLGRVANVAKEHSLTGMEFAAGIPGTIGGAMVMNAGAYGGEMKDIVEYVDVLEADFKVRRYTCDEMEFSYRHSIIDKDKIVIGAALKLANGSQESIVNRMNELKEARVSKQPLEYPSAGSTFKRPEGYFAGKLIQDAGLKGYSVGGAKVSEKHCGFVINYDHASAKDILDLIEDVKRIVYEETGVSLEPEVRIIK